MARRTVLTSRQRSAFFSIPPREADLRRHDTLSDDHRHLPTSADEAEASPVDLRAPSEAPHCGAQESARATV